MPNLKMVHPDIEAVAEVVDESVFNAVWAPRGWVILGQEEAWASERLGRKVTDLEKDLKLDELKALVAYRGAEYPASERKKSDVVKLYGDTFAEPAAPVPGDTEVFSQPEPEVEHYADDGSGVGVEVVDATTDQTGGDAGEGPAAGTDNQQS
jgi:hypothetical protein